MGLRNFFTGVDTKLLEEGEPGRAVVQRAWKTGSETMGKEVFEFELEIAPEGGTPYRGKHKQAVPHEWEHRVFPGMTLAVKLDPKKPDKVAIDWEGTSGSDARAAPVQEMVIDARAGAAPTPGGDPASRLAQLSQLRDAGIITQQDFDAKKAEILADM